MIVDTSALVAIFARETEGDTFARLMSVAGGCAMSAGSYVEMSGVLTRRFGADPVPVLDWFARRFAVTIEPVTVEQARLGQLAYRTYGRGTGHPARLNLGDCFAYALAKATGEPLLFKGDDFNRTDIRSAA